MKHLGSDAIYNTSKKLAKEMTQENIIAYTGLIFIKLYDIFGFSEVRLRRLLDAINVSLEAIIYEQKSGNRIDINEIVEQLKQDTNIDLLEEIKKE